MELDFSKNIKDSSELQQILADQKSRKQINDLPDSDFAYVEPGGKKVDGKTVPRSLRHLPIMDCAHVRNALARVGQTKISPQAKAQALKKIKAAAKKCGVEVSESDAKDWDKIDKDELKHDNKKEKKEHYKDAVKDDKDHIKKLEKDEKIDKKKESEAATDKQKAARDAFMEMIKKKKGGDKDDKKSDDKDDKKSDDKKDKKSEDKKESKAADEDRDKKELDRDDKKEKAEHEKDAIKDDKDQVDHLKEDEREDKKALKEDEAMMMKKTAMQMKEDEAMKMKYAKKVEDNEAMLKMKSRIDEIDKARNDMEVEKSMTQKKLDAMMQKMRASDAP